MVVAVVLVVLKKDFLRYYSNKNFNYDVEVVDVVDLYIESS